MARNKQFLLFLHCFLPFGEFSTIFIKFEICVCKLFQFRPVQNIVIWERVVVCTCFQLGQSQNYVVWLKKAPERSCQFCIVEKQRKFSLFPAMFSTLSETFLYVSSICFQQILQIRTILTPVVTVVWLNICFIT